MTAVSDQVLVPVVAPIDNSDHISVSAVISIAQAVPILFDNKVILLKHQVNNNIFCAAIQDLPWR